MPLTFNSANRVHILNQLLDEPYGWGGLLNNKIVQVLHKIFCSIWKIFT